MGFASHLWGLHSFRWDLYQHRFREQDVWALNPSLRCEVSEHTLASLQGLSAQLMAHSGRQTIISSNLWVLEYLLEQDKVEDELIKHFYDGFLCDVGELPPPIQVRLMLRVLRDNVANITQSSLDALNCLTNFSHESPDLYPPACRVEDLSPALELYVQVF